MTQPTLAEFTAERHANILPTPYYRREYAEATAEALEAVARAAQDMARMLRKDPDWMLAQAFDPTTFSVGGVATSEFEISCNIRSGVRRVAVKGKTPVVSNPIGFRALWNNGTITPTKDNSLGG